MDNLYLQSLAFDAHEFNLCSALLFCGELGVDLGDLEVELDPHGELILLRLPDAGLDHLRDLEYLAPGVWLEVGESDRTPNPLLIPIANIVVGAAGVHEAIRNVGK